MLQQAKETVDVCNGLITPLSVSKRIKIDAIVDDCIILETGATFCNETLAKELKVCSHILLCLATVGKPLDDAISQAFKTDDYLSGMMLDAAGSAAIGNYSRLLWQSFVSTLEKGEGITQGFSPGEKGWDITAQETIFKLLDTSSIGVTLNDACLMTPAKSLSIVFGIGKGIPISKTGHKCDECKFTHCMMRDNRQVIIKIHCQDEVIEIKAKVGSSLMDVLRNHNIYIDAPCGGQGKCGSCKAKFVKLPPTITSFDQATLTQTQLDDGWRLTCKVIVEHPLELILQTVDHMTILTADDANTLSVASQDDSFGIAIDIGTTTVVTFLVNMRTGAIVDRIADMNHQRQFGADVTSRILYSMQESSGKDRLQQTITHQLNDMITQLKQRQSIQSISHVVVAANTVMTHMLLGHDTESLGCAPYTPVSIARESVPCHDLHIDCDCFLTVMEGIAAYVGSDITVGAAEVGLMDKDDYTLFLDLGTNGEMILGNKDHAYCCSTAAGPAFEAANIHCGMGGVTGAISKCTIVQLTQTHYAIKNTVIGNGAPRGICGSGILDITAQLIAHGIIEPSGRISDATSLVKENNELGRYVTIAKEIVFTQKDVREIQLAKAAIAGGIRILLDATNITLDDVKKVCIAGGFGNYMYISSALAIKLVPNDCANKIDSVGNTAGKGAIHALISSAFCDTVARYAKGMKYIELSTSIDFQNYFIEEIGL
jgi:uncharacterized 2Fe-2S/4Fe-4S cluster protein (DUF4445 family)